MRRGEPDEQPVWISRSRAEDAGLEDSWDEDCERFDEIIKRCERIRDTHTGGARTHAEEVLKMMKGEEPRDLLGALEASLAPDAPDAPGAPFQLMALVLLPVGANEYSGLAMMPGAKVVYTNVTPDAGIVGAAERLGRRLLNEKL